MREILATIYELFKTVIFVLVMAFVIRFFLFQPFVVQGVSMEPNMHDSEYLIVDRLTYKFKAPERGEVVIFDAPDHPGTDYIKRVIGLAGEEIEITANQIKINGVDLEEKYLPEDFQTLIDGNSRSILKKNLGADEYFVMGDNRQHSLDSRVFGVIKKSVIVGRAWIVLYPLEYFGRVFEPKY